MRPAADICTLDNLAVVHLRQGWRRWAAATQPGVVHTGHGAQVKETEVIKV